jgi:hypothetical protein
MSSLERISLGYQDNPPQARIAVSTPKTWVDTQPKFQPAYNGGTLVLGVAKATVLANSKQRGRSRDTNRTPKSEIRIRHQIVALSMTIPQTSRAT